MSNIITPEEEVAMLAKEREETLTGREKNMRNKFKEKKPLIYNKIIKHTDKIKRKESVAFIQLEWNYACNFRCQHCYIEDLKKPRAERRLTIANVADIADQADAMDLASFCIS